MTEKGTELFSGENCSVPFSALGRCLLAACCLLVAAGGPRAETALVLRTSNDLGVFLPAKDDLYTASLGADLVTGNLGFTLDERMFTDRDAGLRFDETYLTVAATVPAPSPWEVRVRAGAVRVGRGLFGENLQNLVHRLLNIDEVELDYIEGSETHALLRVEAERPFAATAALRIGPWIDLSEAFGFKRHAILGGALRWNRGGSVSVFARAAARYSDTELAVLEPWMGGWAPAFEAGMGYKEFLTASYTYNAFGTEDGHIHLRFRWSFD